MLKHIIEDRVRIAQGVLGAYLPSTDTIKKSGEPAADEHKGKEIGKTKSGKPIFGTKKASHEDYKDFSKDDHHDAADAHRKTNFKNAERFAQQHDEAGGDRTERDKAMSTKAESDQEHEGSEKFEDFHKKISTEGTKHLPSEKQDKFWNGYEKHMESKKQEHGDKFKEDDHHEEAVKEGAKAAFDKDIAPKDEADKVHN